MQEKKDLKINKNNLKKVCQLNKCVVYLSKQK